MASTRAGMGRGVVVSPLNLELLGTGGEGGEGSQNLRTATLSFCEVSHRGVSSMESLEYQDKYVTPLNYSEDSESDMERARIVEEAALVAEKLMTSQLSKMTFESELRTMETRFPTRVNSPRYYNEKKEVMDRANRMLMGKRADCSVPRFLQDRLGWFNCVESFFSACSDEHVVEENGGDSVMEVNSYFSPSRRSNLGKSVHILKGVRTFGERGEEKRKEGGGEVEVTKTQTEKRLGACERSSGAAKPSSTGGSGALSRKKLGEEKVKLSGERAEANRYRCQILGRSPYDVENDVFYLDDGAGYVTFSASKLDLGEMEKRPKATKTKSKKDGEKVKPLNSDIENQKMPTYSMVNVNTESGKKSPARRTALLAESKAGEKLASEKIQGQEAPSNSSPKKECKKKLRALRQVSNGELGGPGSEKSFTRIDRDILNYSTNYIRGRMDYISTDVFV
ncbi:hypothetical protein OJ253_3137 [Cryptosporidium canis]|uniref:Uncharacterized protein n=1 Tax=Cryptosporidium canis TaxID=195482 RepID=A0A9D5DED1_9CRYT|nr:hypothetical protein OJ253_3137 [Cryptosporidium canis]